MAIISKDNNFLTLINIFTVEPDQQQALIEVLTQATGKSVRHIDGFISSSIHRSIDGTKVVMYAQWRSLEDYRSMRNDTSAMIYFEQALSIAKFEPGMYEVIETFSPDQQ